MAIVSARSGTSRPAIVAAGLRKSFELDLRAHGDVGHRQAGHVLSGGARGSTDQALGLVGGTALRAGQGNRPPDPRRGRSGAEFLHGSQRHVHVRHRVTQAGLQAQFADAGMGYGPHPRIVPASTAVSARRAARSTSAVLVTSAKAGC